MRRLMGYLKPYLPKMGVQFVIKTVGTVVELFLPWMLSKILDSFAPAGQLDMIYLWGALMILCCAVAFWGNVAANRMATAISKDVTQKLRHDLFCKISFLNASQVDDFTTPSLVARLTSDTYNTHQMIDRMQRLGVRAPILLVGGIAMSLALDVTLSLVLLATLPLLGAVVYFVSKKGVVLYSYSQGALDKMVRKVQENMSGVRVIKALSKEGHERAQFDLFSSDLAKKEQTAGLLMATTNPAMNLLLNVGLCLVIVVGAYRVDAGVCTPGTIIAFLSYFTIILNALMMVSRMFVMYSKGAASAQRIDQVLSAPDCLPIAPAAQQHTDDFVRFDRVSFSYGGISETLHDISFCLRRGETLGIIGPTGSGKSTILNLLLRFYDADSGQIYIDGKKIDTYDPKVLHQMFGVVFQNDFLFADTVQQNIDFGREILPNDRQMAMDTAQAQFVFQKEQGIHYPLTVRGSNLSGGQKQRLLIARALAKRPQILLLDDCSSALDYKTDAALRRDLSQNYGDTTTVIVAQRISSILHANHILVLDDGLLVGQGTHQQLMKSCETYAQIYHVQMGEEC